MAEDPIEKRFERRQKDKELRDFGRRTRSVDDLQAEEEMLKKAEKVKPIQGGEQPGRNDPCPCGSGKKYKKCCGAK
jgi:uncharacterized protein YecA (UPF0149 family)